MATGLWSPPHVHRTELLRPDPGRDIGTARLSDPGSHALPKGKKNSWGWGQHPPRAPQSSPTLCPFSGPPGKKGPSSTPAGFTPTQALLLPHHHAKSAAATPPPRIGCHSPDSTTRVPYPSLAHPLPAPPGVRGPARPMSTGAMPRSPPSSPEASSTQAGLGLPSPFTGLHPILGPS